MLLKAMAVEFDKKKKRSGRMRNELGLPTIYFYFFQSYIRNMKYTREMFLPRLIKLSGKPQYVTCIFRAFTIHY